MPRRSTYDKSPKIAVSASARDVQVGWRAIVERLKGEVRRRPFLLCVECYPGSFEGEIERELRESLRPDSVFRAADCYLSESEIKCLCEPDLGDDPVFGRMSHHEINDFLDGSRLVKAHAQIRKANGLVLVIGTGASLLAEQWDSLVYADMARWEIQQRQRAGTVTNLGLNNADERASLKYKRAFFVDWRAADRLKKRLFDRIDFLLDTNNARMPKMIRGRDLLRGLLVA